MVRLSIDLIARGTSGYTKKKKDEEMDHYLKRLTHLYLEGKSIDEVVSVEICYSGLLGEHITHGTHSSYMAWLP